MLTFTGPKRHPLEEVQQMTTQLAQQFQAIDERLTLEHFDTFIDYGPEVFPNLAALYWDPQVPNHPMASFVYYKYVLRLDGWMLYSFTPYSELLDQNYSKYGDLKDPLWALLKTIEEQLLTIIHDYQIKNLAYWQDVFTEEQYQEEINQNHSYFFTTLFFSNKKKLPSYS